MNNPIILMRASLAEEEMAAAIKELKQFVETERCGDASCCFGPPDGMATNGGCRCLDKQNTMDMRAKAHRMARFLGKIAKKF